MFVTESRKYPATMKAWLTEEEDDWLNVWTTWALWLFVNIGWLKNKNTSSIITLFTTWVGLKYY